MMPMSGKAELGVHREFQESSVVAGRLPRHRKIHQHSICALSPVSLSLFSPHLLSLRSCLTPENGPMSKVKLPAAAENGTSTVETSQKSLRYPFWFGGSAASMAAVVTHPLDLGT